MKVTIQLILREFVAALSSRLKSDGLGGDIEVANQLGIPRESVTMIINRKHHTGSKNVRIVKINHLDNLLERTGISASNLLYELGGIAQKMEEKLEQAEDTKYSYFPGTIGDSTITPELFELVKAAAVQKKTSLKRRKKKPSAQE